MSQFIFGEVIGGVASDDAINGFSSYPFALRFVLQNGDFYKRVSCLKKEVRPFVITDGPYDNTAELLLRLDKIQYYIDEPLQGYDLLLSLTLAERLKLLSMAIKDMLNVLRADECILVMSDGHCDTHNIYECSVSDLYDTLIEDIQLSDEFFTQTYRITK